MPDVRYATRRDEKLDSIASNLPTPRADDALPEVALEELADSLCVAGNRRLTFSRSIRLAVERFFRMSPILGNSPRGVQRKALNLLQKIKGRISGLEDDLEELLHGEHASHWAREQRLTPEGLAYDLVAAYERRLRGPQWLVQIDDTLSTLGTACRFAAMSIPHGNQDVSFFNFVLELADIYEEYAGSQARKPSSTQPSNGFSEFAGTVFGDIFTWGRAHYTGLDYSASTDSLRVQIARAFKADDELFERRFDASAEVRRRRTDSAAKQRKSVRS